jgi:hypothetical protein
MEQNPSWEANSRSREEISHLTEPEGSLPCLQENATGSYSELDESTPQLLSYRTLHI